MDGIENYTWLVLLGVGILILVGIPHAVSGWAWVFRKNNERVFADKQIMTAVINACHHKYPSWLDRSIRQWSCGLAVSLFSPFPLLFDDLLDGGSCQREFQCQRPE